MKKKEKYYAVNNQEDEDGYTLYPDNAISAQNVKGKQNISPTSTTLNTPPGGGKQQPGSFDLSLAARPDK